MLKINGAPFAVKTLFDSVVTWLVPARLGRSGGTGRHGQARRHGNDGDADRVQADLDAYLATTPAAQPVRTLAELIAFDRQHAADEMSYFGRDLFGQGRAADCRIRGLKAWEPACRRARGLTRSSRSSCRC